MVAAVGLVLFAAAAVATSPAAATAAEPTVRELVGQRFVVAMRGIAPSPALLGRVRRGEIGGVILFGFNIRSRAQLHQLTTTLQGAARAAGRPPLLIATDQEGGRVRRLPWAGPSLSATELGAVHGGPDPARGAAGRLTRSAPPGSTSISRRWRTYPSRARSWRPTSEPTARPAAR